MIQSSISEQSKGELISFFSERSVSLLWATLAIGFMVMTVIEYLKPYFRHRFHRNQLQRWLNQDFHHSPSTEGERNTQANYRPETDVAMKELINLSAAGDGSALFSLPLEQLCGQLALGVQSAIESSQRYKGLLWALVRTNDLNPETEVDLELIFSRESINGNQELENWKERTDGKTMRYIAARNRISNHIQRRIDAFQINSARLWKTWIRIGALYVAIILSLIIAYLFSTFKMLFSPILLALTIGYLAAFTAGIFRDLTALIEKQRR